MRRRSSINRFIGPLAVLIVTALAAHWATLAYTPSLIMDRTLSTLKNRGVAEHAFTTPQRITPQTQAVVRTSPDLFYSLCRYDFAEVEGGAIRITMGEWPGYQSLSLFDAETNNYATYRGTGASVSKLLISPSAVNESDNPSSPTTRGVVLIRRLAPTQELFDQAMQAAESDKCEPLLGVREDINNQLERRSEPAS